MKVYKTTVLTASFHRAMVLNLMTIPKSQRYLGRTEPQCDFCSNPKPTMLYYAHRTTEGSVQDCWRWCACTNCHALITANDFNKLYENAAAALGANVGIMRAAMIAFHADAIYKEDK